MANVPGGNPGPMVPKQNAGKDNILRQGHTAADLYGNEPNKQGIKEVPDEPRVLKP